MADVAEADETRIKGTALIPSFAFLEDRVGPDWRDRIWPTLPSEQQRLLEGIPLPMQWFPFSLALRLIDGLIEAVGTEDVLRDLATHNLDYATGAIFRVIFKVGSPTFMISRSPTVWRTYYDRGRMEVPEVEKDRAVVDLYEFPALTPRYSRVVLHSMEAVVRKAGGQAVEGTVVEDLARGDARSRYLLRW